MLIIADYKELVLLLASLDGDNHDLLDDCIVDGKISKLLYERVTDIMSEALKGNRDIPDEDFKLTPLYELIHKLCDKTYSFPEWVLFEIISDRIGKVSNLISDIEKEEE